MGITLKNGNFIISESNWNLILPLGVVILSLMEMSSFWVRRNHISTILGTIQP